MLYNWTQQSHTQINGNNTFNQSHFSYLKQINLYYKLYTKCIIQILQQMTWKSAIPNATESSACIEKERNSICRFKQFFYRLLQPPTTLTGKQWWASKSGWRQALYQTTWHFASHICQSCTFYDYSTNEIHCTCHQ